MLAVYTVSCFFLSLESFCMNLSIVRDIVAKATYKRDNQIIGKHNREIKRLSLNF